jgi:glycosyltransferase involved in cell wall biosynthesis
MGTPGTYCLSEAFSKFALVCVVSNSDVSLNDVIVCEKPTQFSLNEISFSKDDYLERINTIVQDFKPDVVIMASHPRWYRILLFLTDRYQKALYVYDIKSPLLSRKGSTISDEIKREGNTALEKLDLVITRSKGDISTWFNNLEIPVVEYPLGTLLGEFHPRTYDLGFMECKRFVYVGTFSHLRKLDVLLQHIHRLPSYLRDELEFDFYGKGPALENFKAQISELGIGDFVKYRGVLKSCEVPKKLVQYDAGLAWVPKEKYDSAPSLKLIEYIAAGILPIATDTTAHKHHSDEGFNIRTFSESSPSFTGTIIEACTKGYPKKERLVNLEKIWTHDWNHIASSYLIPSFTRYHRQKFNHPVNPTQDKKAKMMNGHIEARQKKVDRFKIYPNFKLLIISPRPFGLMGTPGTYLLSESFSKFVETHIVVSKLKNKSAPIVYEKPAKKSMIEVDYKSQGSFKKIRKYADKIEPNAIIINNYSQWHHIFKFLKKRFKKTAFILDIKSPLITDNNEILFAQIQDKGNEVSNQLDLVMTRCQEDVETWIPKYSGPVLTYPLGIKIDNYIPKNRRSDTIHCKRYVYIGSIHKIRKIDMLLRFISDLPDLNENHYIFDFFGTGPFLDEAIALSGKLRINKSVNFKGSIDNDLLSKILPTYDAGIAWVPHEVFDHAPSLKLLEYMAAGLVPLAMNTKAHMRYSDMGFKIMFFEESSKSFGEVIQTLYLDGFETASICNNSKAIEDYDWDVVAKNVILPRICSLTKRVTFENRDRKQRPAIKEDVGLKLLYISPRPFGLMGTPGTYQLAESLSKICRFQLVANDVKTENIGLKIVHFQKNELEVIKIKFGTKQYLESILDAVRTTGSQIVIIGNYARWFEVASFLSNKKPDIKLILDVKSPLIVDGDECEFERIKRQNLQGARFLSAVMSYTHASIDSWLPGYTGRKFIYPLGIKTSEFSNKHIETERVKCRKFVYIGSLQKFRKIDQLIEYFSNVSKESSENILLDIYGDGPEIQRLEKEIGNLGSNPSIRIQPPFSSDEKGTILSQYQAGIAWVPHNFYDESPSLKLLEYFASGLYPLATNTQAHEGYQKEGFAISFFTASYGSFKKAIINSMEKGVRKSDITTNQSLVKKYDWDSIAENMLLPIFHSVNEMSNKVASANSNINKKVRGKLMNDGDLELFKKVHLWDLPLKDVKYPQQKSGIRAAALLGNHLYYDFHQELNLFPITLTNWRHVLEYGEIDFLIAESSWKISGAKWSMYESIPGEINGLLKQLVTTAKGLKIPTVFWMTKDHLYHEHFAKFASLFDIVYCADPLETELMHSDGIHAQTLLPYINQREFNPFVDMIDNLNLETGILYDGWVDLFRYPEIGDILKNFTTQNLNIFQTDTMMYRQQLKRIDKSLVKHIRGSVDRNLLPYILKSGYSYLSFEKSSSTETKKQWSILEAEACRTSVAHLGNLGSSSIFNDFVNRFDREKDLCNYISTSNKVGRETDRKCHLAWRNAHQNHCLDMVITKICKDIGVKTYSYEHPKATLVTGTIRPELFPKCIEQYENQTYSNKELILIYNGNFETIREFKSQFESRNDIFITAIPTEDTVGTVLNYGVGRSTGDYFFRVDDDDHYGDNYILDIMLHLRSVDADIIGKRASFFQFENDDSIYLRDKFLPKMQTFPANYLHESQDTLISGCSLSGKIDVLKRYKFPDNIHASVDTALVDLLKSKKQSLNCAIVDSLNLVVQRAEDVKSQTWRVDSKSIKNRSEALHNISKKIFV